MEADESEPAQTALREAIEESGLRDLVLSPGGQEPALLDIDVHLIPESPTRGEPAHFHYDFCYLARTARPDDARIDRAESRAFRWVTPAELGALELDPATRRRLLKAFAEQLRLQD